MKNCDKNLKLDDSFATNKKNVPMRKEDFLYSADPNEMSPMWHPIRVRTVYRIIPEYRILRRTFQRKSASKS